MKRLQKNLTRLSGKIAFGVSAVLCSLAAYPASLTLEFYDEQQQPLAQVVAALIPLNKSGYPSAPSAVMDQRNNMFVPDVLAVRTNTLVHFPNSDNIRHHVYSFSPAKRFELRLYHGQTAEPVLFDQPGRVVLGCNIHDSMLAYIYVVDSDYYAVADEQGKLTIKEIPAGDYQLVLQHPQWENELSEAETITLTATDVLSRRILVAGKNSAPAQESAESDLKKLFKRNN